MVYHDINIPLGGFIAIDWTLFTFTLGLIIVRLALRRRRQIHSLAANISDVLLVASWLIGIVDISINAWKNSLRLRYIHWPRSELYYGVPHDQSAHLLEISWISLYFIYISLWLAKFAFIAFYYDIFFRHSSRVMQWALHSVALFAAATFIVQISLLTFWCNPISGNWNVDGELCSAVHSITSVTISTFTNVATDLLIMSIPISAIAHANLRKVEVAGLIFVLLLGSISIITAIARFIVLKIVEHVPRASITHTIDTCATIEIVASLIANCLPSLRTFIRQQRPESTKGSRSRSPSSTRSPLQSDSGGTSASPPLDRHNSSSQLLMPPAASFDGRRSNSLQPSEKGAAYTTCCV